MNILYFASLKESLNISNEEILATPDMTVMELRSLLINQYGERHFPMRCKPGNCQQLNPIKQ